MLEHPVQPRVENTHINDWTRKGRVPILDGLRAIAIALVIWSHYYTVHPTGKLLKGVGHLGVTCFFVISGFLITLLLLREHERRGSISLKGFYARRALRILPASFTYL